jgi:hypothetical protein
MANSNKGTTNEEREKASRLKLQYASDKYKETYGRKPSRGDLVKLTGCHYDTVDKFLNGKSMQRKVVDACFEKLKKDVQQFGDCLGGGVHSEERVSGGLLISFDLDPDLEDWYDRIPVEKRDKIINACISKAKRVLERGQA